MSRFYAFLLILLLSAASLFAQRTNAPLFIGRVAVNKTHIAFTYAGKIWLVERAGGAARKLNDAGAETNPVFSPDGKQIAFARWSGGDFDVYVSAATGGEAKRLTFQGEDDFPVAWTPDGQAVVFESTRDEEGVTRLHKVAANGGVLDESLPLPQAFQGSFSPNGKQIAYNPRAGFGEWRYYRGGATAPVWIADLQTGAVEKLPNQNYNDRFPMWLGDKIYTVSDRTGVFNLFSIDRKTKQAKQLTTFDGQGIRTAAGSGNAIVFVQNGRLHLFDTAAGQSKTIDVSVTAPDTSELKPKTVPAMRFVESFVPSANGEKTAFGARGEVLIFDKSNNESKNLTNTSGAAERYPTIAPDGKSVAYFSDESGEYALHVRSLENDSVVKISIEKQPSFYRELAWSPDSKKLVFSDRQLNLWLADIERATAAKVDASGYSAQENWSANFSPDSKFLTYAKRLKNRAGTVYIRDLAAGKNIQITDGVAHAEAPVFDANGKYLYFASSPNAGTSEFEWGVLNGVLANPLVVKRVHALRLAIDTPSLLLPNNQPNPDAKPNEAAPQTKIDFENLLRRFVDLPLPLRNYSRILAGRPGKIHLVASEFPVAPGDVSIQNSLVIYSVDAAQPAKMDKFIEGIGSYELTGDGSRILYQKGRDWFLVSTDAAPKTDEGKLDLSKMEVKVNPAEEWRQMFRESMRIMRDWFYDPNYHGQNLAALEREYAAYLPTTTRRGDLNALIRQMLGHVSVSHLGVGGGDTVLQGGGGSGRVGLLGADYEIADGKIRFKRIYRSTSYASSNGSFSAPLDQAGVDVRIGDYLLEVNGNKVETNKNFYSYFENTIGKPTRIVVSSDVNGNNPRAFTVYPAAGENRLRRANWAEANQKRVEQMSGGKLGYIFIENYDPNGIMNAIRGLTGYADRQGIIVDQRYNGGGITPDYLIEWMQRKPLYYYHFRGGDDIATPVNPAPPVKVMLINEWNGSAAETGAFMFQLGKVGKIVGKRTYGAGIGPYFFTPRLIDGGQIQLPNRAAYNPDGSGWGIENLGVAPDYDVEIMPQDYAAGKDAQLEKAVEVAMTEIAKLKPNQPKLPVFPAHPAVKTTAGNGSFVLPVPGSSFPITDAKVETPKPVTNGKFADYVGQFETPMGLLTFQQEGEKFVGVSPEGERLELAADAAAKDKFAAQTASVQLTFERDAGGKVVGLTLVIPSGRELKGKRVK
ncbi:MAG: tolB protein precursor, periplasmic protein involved in the tonb-independent uptake of group A colicins [uncultured Pyrinomonadaceae bacterium]|uniref:TolB protein, periplasmic protein involved in the tonb-independent uptake of group A colicins n=1 Tax=uncultured Pyrinomonadaceae bacterium TaxID=2283094 RepID=A0A6J4Q8L6_9BACT|nr:MAG: tolB protein precursor, periplasmic protein involved in the tonb-independent uptake of group A colicins [uncultured Pyrinomonadaceae bacterium]